MSDETSWFLKLSALGRPLSVYVHSQVSFWPVGWPCLYLAFTPFLPFWEVHVQHGTVATVLEYWTYSRSGPAKHATFSFLIFPCPVHCRRWRNGGSTELSNLPQDLCWWWGWEPCQVPSWARAEVSVCAVGRPGFSRGTLTPLACVLALAWEDTHFMEHSCPVKAFIFVSLTLVHTL